MAWSWTLLTLVLTSQTNTLSTTAQTQNANHIFNAIHSSMRQWGSSLNHNGMSLFLATVPQGTLFYHGTHEADRINGTEWLTFEPEHAAQFARCRREPHSGMGGPPEPPYIDEDGDNQRRPPDNFQRRPKFMSWQHGGRKQDLKPGRVDEERTPSHPAHQRARAGVHIDQEPFNDELGAEKEEDCHGYLHTYKPEHDLRLLYIDGQSGAKSSRGTLDMQDVVLLRKNPPRFTSNPQSPSQEELSKRKHPRGPMNEGYRAEKLCELAQNEWQDRVDGFLRMELGFEIILCDFERHLNVERIAQVKPSGGKGGRESGDSLSYYQAVASRFDGIGGNRVHINYDTFITLFAVEGAVSFDNEGFPRSRNETNVLAAVSETITEMVLRKHENRSFDWQAVVDMIVARYSDRIEYLASGELKDLACLQAEIDRALRPFIDYSDRNTTNEIHRCSSQYTSGLPRPTSLAARAIANVTTTICTVMIEASESEVYTDALHTVRDLKRWLAWSTWKRCRGCSNHEVCFIPIWPMGGQEDYDSPQCVSNMSQTRRGYWDDMHHPHWHKREQRQ